MAGMFGRREAIPGLPELSFADRAAIFGGAMLSPQLGQLIKDRKTIIPAQREYMSQLAERVRGTPERQVQMPVGNEEGQDISAAFSPQMQTQPGKAPLSIGDKDLPGLALRAQQLGIPLDGLLDVLKAQQPSIKVAPDGRTYNERDPSVLGQRFGNPTNINGWIKDLNKPENENTYSPQLPEGMIPDGKGGVAYPNGLVPQLAGRAGAIAGAEAGAKAPYQFQTFQGPDGRPITGSTSALAGQVFQGQSPTEALQATAATETAIGLPQHLATSQGALDLIGKLKAHPGLDARTGLTAVLPAMPGTPGADFDSMATQLRGKVFLEAFSSLKGAGAITDREGQAATDAIARLSQRQTKEGYTAALNDLERVIQAGVQRQQQKAGRSDPARRASPPVRGQVVKGYTYLGGDPSSPRSWAKAR